jgi:hypothetical protein
LKWSKTLENQTFLEPGEQAKYARRISADDIRRFAEISEDFAPIHVDEDFAKNGHCIVDKPKENRSSLTLPLKRTEGFRVMAETDKVTEERWKQIVGSPYIPDARLANSADMRTANALEYIAAQLGQINASLHHINANFLQFVALHKLKSGQSR